MPQQLMSKKATLILSFVVCFMLVSASSINRGNATVFAAEDKCVTVTKDDLAKSINEKIKGKYQDQQNHLNVSVKDNIVTLDGWVTTKDVKKEIEKFAKKTKCVKKVINSLGIGPGAGCTRQQQQCRDICISNSSECTN